MIIDNPHVLRRIIHETNPYFTHPGAEEIYTKKAKDMDEYAARYAPLADKVWEEEYLSDKKWSERIRTFEKRSFKRVLNETRRASASQ